MGARLPHLAAGQPDSAGTTRRFCGPIRYNRCMFESPPVVIVTGSGGSGCGRAIAARWAAEGAAVVVSDIHEAGGQETVRLIEKGGGRATFCRADVADESQVRHLIDFAQSTFGALSVLINNASSPHPTGEGMAGWFAESPRGISPRGAHRSGRKPLDLSGSCHRLEAAASHQDHRVPPVSR
jgi:short chain dehydrogenase